MASTNPNPFLVPLEKSVVMGFAADGSSPFGPSPFASPLAATLPVTAPLEALAVLPAVAPATSLPLPAEAGASAPPSVGTAPEFVPGIPSPPPPSPASAGSFGTWNDSWPDTTQSQHAITALRRAQLSRVVRSIVTGSAVVCVLAVARIAVSAGKGPDIELHCASHVSMKGTSATFSTVHDDPAILMPATPTPAAKHGRRHGRRH